MKCDFCTTSITELHKQWWFPNRFPGPVIIGQTNIPSPNTLSYSSHCCNDRLIWILKQLILAYSFNMSYYLLLNVNMLLLQVGQFSKAIVFTVLFHERNNRHILIGSRKDVLNYLSMAWNKSYNLTIKSKGTARSCEANKFV